MMPTVSPLPFSPSHARPPRGPAPSRGAGLFPLTVVIPCLNEGQGIASLVAELAWADEVIVVDGGSTDDTVKRAEGVGARVLVLRDQTIAAQRNHGIDAARNRWILSLDADERVSMQLRAEIGQVVSGRSPTH